MKQFAPAPVSPRQHRRSVLLAISLCLLFIGVPAEAQDRPDRQDRVVRVARVSLVEGDVNYQRSHDRRDEWFDATANLPLNENDQLFTGNDGRTEIQLTGGNLIRLSRNTNLKVSQFNNSTMQFALSGGTGTFRIGSLDRRQLQIVDASSADNNQPIYFEVDTPIVAITLLREGNYRINVADDGSTELIVRQGAAEVYNKELGTVNVKEGRRITIDGADATTYQMRKLEDRDDWDRWNERRDEELFARAEYRSTRYVPVHVPGVYDLDLYGDWYDAPGYGWVWSPRAVASGWAPYRSGCWRWYPSFGWTWIAHEPWGWAPYHYGRWAYWSNRWCWVPRVTFGVSFGWGWSPALVSFYGTRGTYGRGYRNGGYDWIGWVPLAPGEQAPGRVAGGQGLVIARADTLRNFSAPGGVSGVEGHNFEQSRVMVHNVVSPPNRSQVNRSVDFVPLQVDQVKPTEADVPRTVHIPRSGTGRDLSGPVVVRREPSPTRDATSASPRPSRELSPTPAVPEGGHAERPSRVPDFTPVERPTPPPTRSRETPPAKDPGVTAPSERVVAPRRQEQASPPEQRQMPSRGGSTSSSPPSASPPRPERQAPPERAPESAPKPERQAAPVPERSRESAPPPARTPPPTRKPDPNGV